MQKLTLYDCCFILESLKYTKKAFREMPIGKKGYPDYEFKQAKLNEVDSIISKMRNMRNELKKEKK